MRMLNILFTLFKIIGWFVLCILLFAMAMVFFFGK